MAGITVAGVWAQTLGDMANQAAESRRTTGPAARTYTDADAKRNERESPVVVDPVPSASYLGSYLASSPELDDMRRRADTLFAVRLGRLNLELRQKNQQYRALLSQAAVACAGSIRIVGSPVGTRVFSQSLVTIQPDGSAWVHTTSYVAPPVSSKVIALDDRSTSVCRDHVTRLRGFQTWGQQLKGQLDVMCFEGMRVGIHPNVVRGLIAARLRG